MTLFAEAKTSTTTESAATSLLAMLKAGIGLGNSGKNGLFASLLAETKNSDTPIVALDPVASSLKTNVASVASATVTSSAGDNDASSLATPNASLSARTSGSSNKDGSTTSKRAVSSDTTTDQDSSRPEVAEKEKAAAPQAADAQEEKTVAVCAAHEKGKADKGTATTGTDEDDQLDEATLAQLMAALAPFVAATAEAVTGDADANAAATAQADETGAAAASKEDLASMIEAELQALMAQYKADGAGDEAAATSDADASGQNIGADKKTVLAAMQKIAQALLAQENAATGATTDAPALTATAGDLQTTVSTNLSLGEFLGQGLGKQKPETTLAPATGKAKAQAASSLLGSAETTVSTAPTTGALAANISAALQSAADEAAGEAAGASVRAATTSKSGASQPTLSEGVRTAGSYDFANQLSAARVLKGGATGLPQAIEQVAVQLHKLAKEGVDQMTIQLRPAELGKIEIKLSFGADKTVTGTVVADNQATLTLLQKDPSGLTRALTDAGLQADAGSLQFSLRGDGQQGQFAQNQTDQNAHSFLSQDASGASATDADDAALGSTETYYITPGRVNLRV